MNPMRANELVKKAEQGDADAQGQLGWMYYKGLGVPQDYQEAVRWFRAAAEQGEAKAQFNLGLMYYQGEGVLEDFVQAHMWANLAASQLKGDDRKNSAELRDQLAQLMTREQIAEAQRLSREWKPKGSGSQ